MFEIGHSKFADSLANSKDGVIHVINVGSINYIVAKNQCIREHSFSYHATLPSRCSKLLETFKFQT